MWQEIRARASNKIYSQLRNKIYDFVRRGGNRKHLGRITGTFRFYKMAEKLNNKIVFFILCTSIQAWVISQITSNTGSSDVKCTALPMDKHGTGKEYLQIGIRHCYGYLVTP